MHGQQNIAIFLETKNFLVVSTVLTVICLNVRRVDLCFFLLNTLYTSHRNVVKACVPALDGDGWSVLRSGRFTSGKHIRFPLYRRPAGPQDQSGRVRTISTAPELDPRVFQCVSSSYTECTVIYPTLCVTVSLDA